LREKPKVLIIWRILDLYRQKEWKAGDYTHRAEEKNYQARRKETSN